MAVIDNAVYIGGRRVAEPESLEQSLHCLRAAEANAMADPMHQADAGPPFCWLGLVGPSQQEMASVADGFGLHGLAVEDAVSAHQRPKVEQYGEVIFVVLRPARYVDRQEIVDIGELHVFLGNDFVITVRHGNQPDLASVRARLEREPALLRHGPRGVLYAILDRVVDDYAPVVTDLQTDLDDVEVQVFTDDAHASKRAYQLMREMVEFQRAVSPLRPLIEMLHHKLDPTGSEENLELGRLLRDVEDHATRITERVDGYRDLLASLLSVDAALVSRRQNEEMARMTQAGFDQNEQVKRISSWAAILFAPTLIASIYGMNFDHMPELAWRYGYPFAILLMVVMGLSLYTIFKRRNWL